jgi:hypothetical protein
LRTFILLLTAFPLAAGPIYTLVDIGEMGGVSAEAFSVNASGAVAGRAYDAQGNARGFAYDGALGLATQQAGASYGSARFPDLFEP